MRISDKIKSNIKKGLFICLPFLFCFIAFFLVNGNDKSDNPVIHLNAKLDNSMSDIEELSGMDKEIEAFLKKWEIKGASLAIMRNDSLLFAKGYGWADKEAGVKMDAGHILRMASVSKLLTATGIMILQERGMLSLEDKVFGPDGILEDTYMNELAWQKQHKKITVEHLMRHEAGFGRDYMFAAELIMRLQELDKPATADDFIRYSLSRKLQYEPGTSQKYSNFSYLLLSKIIEHVSGQSYETFIKESVLNPAGCYDMHIAGNYYEDRRQNEVRYYTHRCKNMLIEEYNGSGRMVERCYGGHNIAVLSGAGGWCGSPAEIARFVASIDGRDEIPDIISKASVQQMIEYTDKEKFSLGWNDTDPEKGWKRTGCFTGTSAIVKYFPDNECWIMITNTSTWKGPRFSNYTDSLFRKCRHLYGHNLPKRDLF